MHFFFFDVVEKVFLQHHELPLHRVEHLELYLINFMSWLRVDKEVGVVEEGVYQEVGAVLDIVYLSGRRLDK